MEDTLDASGSVQGLTLHGAKVLESIHKRQQYIRRIWRPALPGFTLNQRLEAEVEYLFAGNLGQGRFDDNPLSPVHAVVDTANASVILGEVGNPSIVTALILPACS